jgi:hypothetical protein
MEVAVPAGTIGIRGTSVAGEVDGARATIVLLGPGPSTDTGERVGRILVTAANTTVEVTRPGFGVDLSAANAPPSAPFRHAYPQDEIDAMPGVIDAIRRYDAILARSGTAGASEIVRDADRWPCPECHNERVVRKQGANPPEYRLCSTCRGDPGPRLTPAQLLAQIRVESMLLGSGESSAPSIASEFATPLIDPDPAAVAKWYRVDPALCIWRSGGWVPLNAQDASTPSTPSNAPAAK